MLFNQNKDTHHLHIHSIIKNLRAHIISQQENTFHKTFNEFIFLIEDIKLK